MKKLWFRIKKFWHFIWNDDSLLSWVLSIIVAFIIIRFLFYPVLGIMLGTSHPVVAVVSPSMEHPGSFNSWWETHEEFYDDFGISVNDFENYRFSNGFNKGDILVITSYGGFEVGDVIVFNAREPYPIIHRIVNISEGIYQTKGDNNPGFVVKYYDPRLGIFSSTPSDSSILIIDERNIIEKDIIGKAIFRIPYLGYVKIVFVEAFSAIGFSKLLSFLGISR